MPSGEAPVPAVAGAQDKVRAYARPQAVDAGDAQSGATIADGAWYATYFRLAMGYDAATSKLGWVRVHDADFVGGAASAGSVVLCDEQGRVVGLDGRTGATDFEADLGEPVKACVVNVDVWRAPGSAAAGDAKPLGTELGEALLADDPQLVPMQKVFLHDIAAEPDESATKVLVDLASDPRTSPDLIPSARVALANRKSGAKYMEAALARHYDYLKDVLRAPPVGPMAHALAVMKDSAAAPLLASHLLDPADTDDDVMQAAAALLAVGGPPELPSLRQFFGMYGATAAPDATGAAVVSAGRAIAALDPGARPQLEAVAHHESTVEYARDRLADALKAPPPPAAGDSKKAP